METLRQDYEKSITSDPATTKLIVEQDFIEATNIESGTKFRVQSITLSRTTPNKPFVYYRLSDLS
ncbi:MAG TPA: hypothetical protein PK957_02500 [Candidatus Dojkabacteria bacterium]|nr:hypothetical protein [Candidatus Dojkabacteria bacterium]HQF36385.1 hypothetical protein [Candidatus Dojkabacteria bacterium]